MSSYFKPIFIHHTVIFIHYAHNRRSLRRRSGTRASGCSHPLLLWLVGITKRVCACSPVCVRLLPLCVCACSPRVCAPALPVCVRLLPPCVRLLPLCVCACSPSVCAPALPVCVRLLPLCVWIVLSIGVLMVLWSWSCACAGLVVLCSWWCVHAVIVLMYVTLKYFNVLLVFKLSYLFDLPHTHTSWYVITFY